MREIIRATSVSQIVVQLTQLLIYKLNISYRKTEILCSYDFREFLNVIWIYTSLNTIKKKIFLNRIESLKII